LVLLDIRKLLCWMVKGKDQRARFHEILNGSKVPGACQAAVRNPRRLSQPDFSCVVPGFRPAPDVA
jgi:hypothetical protein